MTPPGPPKTPASCAVSDCTGTTNSRDSKVIVLVCSDCALRLRGATADQFSRWQSNAMPRSRRGAQQPDTTLSQHMVDGVVIPGVRLVPSRKLAATKGGTSKKNDEDVKGGFWAETQTFKRDIAHLKSVFPGT